jgi:hypothetical protein
VTRSTIDEIVVADEPEAWARAGFAVDPDGVVRIGAVRVRCAGPAGDTGGIAAWSLRDAGLGAHGIDGLPTAPSDAPPCEPAEHPNGTTAIDHVVVATADWPATIAAFEAAGFDLRRVRDAGTERRPMKQGFFKAGPVVLEIVGAPEPAPDAAPASARFFGLALNAADLDVTKRFYGDACSDPKDAVQPGRRIATLRTRDLGISTAIAFMSE